jgi:hypothetical protein
MSQATASYESSLMKGVDAKTIDSSIRREALRALSNKLYYSLKPSSGALLKSRRTVSFNAQTSRYTSGSVINIKVSANGYIDMSNSYLRWKVCTNRRNVALGRKGTSMLINRLRIEAQSNVIEDLENYNLYVKTMVDHTVSNQYKNTAMMADGWYDDTPRSFTGRLNGPMTITDNSIVAIDNVAFGDEPTAQGTLVDPDGVSKYHQLFYPVNVSTTTGAADDAYVNPVPKTVFCTPLFGSGFCNLQQYIPKQIGALDFQITLENPAIACVAANSAPDYLITDCELIVDTLSLSDDISAMVDKLAAEGKLTLAFDTFMRSSFTLSGTGATNINLTKYAANVKSVYAVMRPQVNVSALTQNVHRIDSFASVPASYITGYFFRLDDAYYPVKKVDSTTQAYVESALKGFNKFNHILYPSCSLQDYLENGKHVIAVDLERDPSSAFTGANTRGGRNIVLTLETDGLTTVNTPAGAVVLNTANQSVDCQVFVLFTRTITIMPSSNYVIAE